MFILYNIPYKERCNIFFLKLSVLRLDTTFFSFLSVLVMSDTQSKNDATTANQWTIYWVHRLQIFHWLYFKGFYFVVFLICESVFFIIMVNFSLICSVFSYKHTQTHNVHVSKNSVKDMHYHTFVSRAVSYVVWNG